MAYIPKGCDQQGRLKTGVYIAPPLPAHNSAEGACGDDSDEQRGRSYSKGERETNRIVGFVVALLIVISLVSAVLRIKGTTPEAARAELACPLI